MADVRDALGPNVAWELVRSTTMKALAPLLRSGELTAVDLAAGGDVVRWPGGPEDWIARIGTEWAALRRDPNIGDIAWFWDFRNDAG